MDQANKWPSWYYGPKGESDVFHSADEVPAGWEDHPSKVISAETTGSKPLQAEVDQIPPGERGSAPVVAANNATAAQTGGGAAEPGDQSNTLDAAGWPWTAELHAPTKSMTRDGLWRMKQFVTRPAPKEGFPKPAVTLDL